jgi:predicted GNAT family N-acyltransferase
MSCHRVGNSSINIRGGIFRGDQLLITGELIYVFADPSSQTSRSVPQALRDTMLGFEQAEPMTTLSLGSWAELKADAAPLRNQVFVQEQGVPVDMEWDEFDPLSLHAVLRNRLGRTIATGRLLPAVAGVAKIGRMAVWRQMRGQGFGELVLLGLVQAAKERGDQAIVLHAQCSAERFYARQGFRSQGRVFQEAGIDHVEMVMAF